MERELSIPSAGKGKTSWSNKIKTCMTDDEANEFLKWIRGKGKVLKKDAIVVNGRIAYSFEYAEASEPIKPDD